MQILGLAFWTASWMTGGIYIMAHNSGLTDFHLDLHLVICDMVGFWANLLNYMIIARVIYMQSKVAGSQNQTYPRKRMTLLA